MISDRKSVTEKEASRTKINKTVRPPPTLKEKSLEKKLSLSIQNKSCPVSRKNIKKHINNHWNRIYQEQKLVENK